MIGSDRSGLAGIRIVHSGTLAYAEISFPKAGTGSDLLFLFIIALKSLKGDNSTGAEQTRRRCVGARCRTIYPGEALEVERDPYIADK